MKSLNKRISIFPAIFFLCLLVFPQAASSEEHPAALLQLAEEFHAVRGQYHRRWEPSAQEHKLDYAELVKKQKEQLAEFRNRFDSIDPTGWPVHSRIDYLLLRSEMDKLEFDLYVLRQIHRNPSFYVQQALTNVSRHLPGGRFMGEYPELVPFSEEKAGDIIKALSQTEQFLAQGRMHLNEIVPELAEIALKQPASGWPPPSLSEGHMDNIVAMYKGWAEATKPHFPEKYAGKLVKAAEQAGRELFAFGEWLKKNKDKMTGRYYIGEDVVNWYIRHVFLMPYDTEELKLIAELERSKALSYLAFEQHANRGLPQIGPAETADEYLAWDDESALALRRWYLEEGQDMLSDQEYQPEIRSEVCTYLPPFGMLAFPTKVTPGVSRILVVPPDHWHAQKSNYGFYTDPGVLHGHEYWPGHTYEGNIHRRHPCPIRRVHRDSGHSEGWCYYNEEILVALDFPFVRGPRARELVYINMLQRAERILIGIPLLCGEITPKQAYKSFLENVPALGSGMGITPEEATMEVYKRVVWRGNDCFDAVAGKTQLLKLMADCKLQQKDRFRLKDFHNEYMKYGQIPISLLKWEMLGDASEAEMFFNPVRLEDVIASR
jgi:hypothetical protein